MMIIIYFWWSEKKINDDDNNDPNDLYKQPLNYDCETALHSCAAS
jgi:hypothetical protein